MDIEWWKDIPGYEGKYQASTKGRIRNSRTGRILALHPNRGYLKIGIMKDGKRRYYRVHRLVWEAFNGQIPDGYEINHINENKLDNRLENLSLLTRKENINWGTHTERAAIGHYKMVMQYDKEGNLVREWESVKSIEEETGWKKGFIANCCRELPHHKTAYGFIWRYAE